MKCIIEGPDGTGKSTLVEKLANLYHCDIVRMTKNGSKKVTDYLDKHNLDNVIFDRSFLSEHVYCSLFGKKPSFSKDDIAFMIKDARMKGYQIIILNCDVLTIKKRLLERGDEFEEVMENVNKIVKHYEQISEEFDIPMIDASKCKNKVFVDAVEILEESRNDTH